MDVAELMHCPPCEPPRAPPRRPKRPFHILTLDISDDGRGVAVALDLPPCLTPLAPPGEWTARDVADHVLWEVRQLRASPSPGLLHIECTGPPAMVINEEGDAVAFDRERQAPPPLVVEVRLRPPESSLYYTENGYRVRLLIEEQYPLRPPEANFMQTIHHFFLDNDNGLPSMFYELLTELVADLAPSGTPPQHTLRATLQLLHHCLQSPLHPCEGCQQQFDAYALMHAERVKSIRDYKPFRHTPELFDMVGSTPQRRAEWLHPELRCALYGGADASSASWDGDEGAREGRLRALLRECVEGVYAFPFLTDAACAMLVAEVDAYAESGLPQARPNSMNKYGLVLNEVGMEATFDTLQREVLQPIAKLLFPIEGGSLDRHHSFVVQYQEGKDLGLDMHTDNSDVTFNVCLGREFAGAGLTFCGYMGAAHHRHFSYRHTHVKGHCVVHLGRRRHGADDIASGERLNLIIWNTNLAHRSSPSYLELQRQHRYEREAAPPDLVCLSYTHDRDYLKYKEKPTMHHTMTRRGWCPPLFAQHDAPSTPSPAAEQHSERHVLDGGDLSDDFGSGGLATGDGAEVGGGGGSGGDGTLEDVLRIQKVLNSIGART